MPLPLCKKGAAPTGAGGIFIFALLVTIITISLTPFASANSDATTLPPKKTYAKLPAYSHAEYDQQLQQFFNPPFNASDDLAKRIDRISQSLLGKPYLAHPLGEGPKAVFDQAPLYRSDQFDCVTFTETVLALARSKNLQEFKHNILDIRYRNPKDIAFINRNHFMEVDWNVHNTRKKWVRDITNSLAIPTKRTTAVIDKPNWYRHLTMESIQYLNAPPNDTALLTQLQNQSAKVNKQQVRLAYIPLDALFTVDHQQIRPRYELFERIPSGTIVEIIRPHWKIAHITGTPLIISHVGIAIRTAQGLMLRHASADQRQVADTPLISYLQKYHVQGSATSVKGIYLLEPV